MRVLLIICLLLFSLLTIASGQQGGKAANRNQPPARKEIRSLNARLNRVQVMRESERLLAQMGYWTGRVDGIFDPGTRAALIAFQKWEGRTVTGKLTIDEVEAIRDSAHNKQSWPQPREAGYTHVEVDLDRQVLMIVGQHGDDATADEGWRRLVGGVRILPVSTGNGKTFIDEGKESIAYTPRGRFVVYDKTFGWENGQLGSVYYANYISGGVAIHGFRSVPMQPASHGCIRIPMFAAREVSKLLKVGTIVLVYDKISFVSAKEWVENPELKEAVLLESAVPDYTYQIRNTKIGSKPFMSRKIRPRNPRGSSD